MCPSAKHSKGGNMGFRPLLVTLVSTFLAACANIEHAAEMQQPLDRTLMAGPGDVVFRVERERNLENIFGKADIWGRKTKEGFSEVRFAGVERTGEVVLYRKDVQIMTNETTLTRTPMAVTSGSATTSLSGSANTVGSSTYLSGSGTTRYGAVTISSGSDYHIAVPSDTIPIRLAPNERKLPISGYVIEIISVSPNSLQYRITRQ
jgi:hypothetical protein